MIDKIPRCLKGTGRSGVPAHCGEADTNRKGMGFIDDVGSGIESTAKDVYNWGKGVLSPTKPDLSLNQGANQRAQQATGAYGAERQNYQPLSAPQIGGGTGPGPYAYAPPPGTPSGAPPSGQPSPAAYGPAVESRSGINHFAPPQAWQPPGYTGMPPTNAGGAGGSPHDMGAPAPQTNQGRQQSALDMLEGAANGTTPSAAQIQSGQQLGTAMANQYALASGLQGRHPGAAFDAASRGAAQVQGNVIGQGAVERANEQAHARDAYAGAVGGARGQDTQIDVANLNAKLTTMGYDEQTRNALLAAQLQAQGYDVATANAMIAAQTQSADSSNRFKGGLIGGAGQLISSLA